MQQTFVKHLQIIINNRFRIGSIQIVKIRLHHYIHVPGIQQLTPSDCPFLHLDYDNAICRTCTPDSSCCRIFQHGDTLHLIHIFRQFVHFKPIHNIERLRSNLLRNRATTPNTYIIVVNRQTGYLSFQQPIQAGTSPQLYRLRRNRGKRPRGIHLL